MNINSTKFKDLKVIKLKRFSDLRGNLVKIFNKKKDSLKFDCFESYVSLSKKGAVRGLHGQIGKFSQAKFIYCLQGKALDIAVDLRKNSKFFGKYVSVYLSDKDNYSFFIPKGFGHGFLCLSKDCMVNYKCSNYRNSKYEKTILWNDPVINIKWPCKKPILSKKDKAGLSLHDFT